RGVSRMPRSAKRCAADPGPCYRCPWVPVLRSSASALHRARDTREKRPLPQIQFLEEIIALVVDEDEGGKVHHLDAPDRFHAEFGIFHHLDLLDAVLGEVRGCAADRAEHCIKKVEVVEYPELGMEAIWRIEVR